jgi:hypothetical protein
LKIAAAWFDLNVTQITHQMDAFERLFVSLRLSCMKGMIPSFKQWETQMTKRSNQEHHELDNLELDAACGGAAPLSSCCGPWIVNGRITMHQPAGPNDWLPGGIYHG